MRPQDDRNLTGKDVSEVATSTPARVRTENADISLVSIDPGAVAWDSTRRDKMMTQKAKTMEEMDAQLNQLTATKKERKKV